MSWINRIPGGICIILTTELPLQYELSGGVFIRDTLLFYVYERKLDDGVLENITCPAVLCIRMTHLISDFHKSHGTWT